MILKDGTEVTADAGGSYKFGKDGMAEYLHILMLNGGSDYSFGDVDSSIGAVDVFGRRILRTDDQGFVWVEKFDTIEEATTRRVELEDAWLDSLNDVQCADCGSYFQSEEGSCWCCGGRTYCERSDR